MLSLQDIDNIVLNGGIVVDADGEKIGSVEQIFTSGDSGDPAFVTVRTGLFGMSESFAPLSGASLEESVIRLAFARDTVRNGPRIDSDRGVITATQEQELYRYYGLDADTASEGSATGTGRDDAPTVAGQTVPAQPSADAVGNEGRMETAGARPVGQNPPHHLPHDGPPPPPPHLRKHVPLPPGPHPGPHPPRLPPGPHSGPYPPPGPPPEPGPVQ